MTDKQNDKSETPTFINANRRGFLQGAAVAGGAAASGVAVASSDHDAAVADPAEQINGKGYELTDHIRKYYQRARF